MDGLPDRRSTDELNPVGCYFHPDRPSGYGCCWCGRTLCLDSTRRVEGADYCPECDPADLRPVFICGSCGTVTFAGELPCPGCRKTETLRQRRPALPHSDWEFSTTGFRRSAPLEVFALVWVIVFILGLAAGAPLPLRGVSLSATWWAILLTACTTSGAMAAGLARQRLRYHLFLSAHGIRVQARGKSTDFLNWNEITRLDWLPPSQPRHLTLRAGERRIELDAGLAHWETVAALVRQHSPIVTPPSIKQCQRRPRHPR